jgi:hypothetical protein
MAMLERLVEINNDYSRAPIGTPRAVKPRPAVAGRQRKSGEATARGLRLKPL